MYTVAVVYPSFVSFGITLYTVEYFEIVSDHEELSAVALGCWELAQEWESVN